MRYEIVRRAINFSSAEDGKPFLKIHDSTRREIYLRPRRIIDSRLDFPGAPANETSDLAMEITRGSILDR